MIKVMHIISSLRRGGRERQLSTIVANTDSTEYQTKIIYFNSSPSNYIAEYDLQRFVLKLNSSNFPGRLNELKKIIKKNRPDLIYTWGNLESIFILLLKPFFNFIFINGSIRHGIRSWKLSHYFRTIVLHLSQHIVANSFAGLKANNLKRGFVLYNGIDNKFLSPLRERDFKRMQLVNIPEKTLMFVSVANLVPYKDYYTVLSALEKIKNLGVDFHYLILGDGPLRKDIDQFINKAGIVNNVTILGNVNNVSEYLKISDIFIHSSKGEGCSNAILEAMAAGLPVVATDTGGTSEIVKPHFGILFKYKDSDQLFTILYDLLSKRKKLKKFGSNAKKEIENKYTLMNMMSKFYKIIGSVMENRSKKNH